MNDTRKQIIDIIWDYMLKDLKFWCFIKSWWKIYKFLYEKETNKNHIAKIYLDTETNLEYEKAFIDKIIWNYDITSVLKYIKNKVWFKKRKIYDDVIMFEEVVNKKINIIKIPNKPLHLYIKEEEKDLLKILIKLQNEFNRIKS